MRSADDLSREEAADIVQRIIDVMYLDYDQQGDFYNPDKSLDGAELIDSVAVILKEYGLVPAGIERLG